jgi:hypothetical protein
MDRMIEKARKLCSIAPAAIFLLLLFGCTLTRHTKYEKHPEQTFSLADIDAVLRSTITNKTASDEALLQAISRLGPRTEPPTFWTEIANDPSYSLWHRTRAVFALFRRHGRTCDSLACLKAVLEPAIWLSESAITKVTPPSGPIPVGTENPGDTVFQISVFHGPPSIYIRLMGEVPIENFSRVLREQQPMIKAQNAIIFEIGYFDDYDAWLKLRRFTKIMLSPEQQP